MSTLDRMNAIEFAAHVALVQNRAGQLGLFKTLHALHAANRVCGFEVAERIQKQAKAS